MITALDIYLVTRCDAIKSFFFVISVIGIISSVVEAVAAATMLAESELIGMAKRLFKVCCFLTLPLAFVFATLNCLTPTSKEVAAMIVIPKIANSEKIKGCGEHVYQLAVEWMNELKPKKKGNEK